jgi:hypothetical protein
MVVSGIGTLLFGIAGAGMDFFSQIWDGVLKLIEHWQAESQTRSAAISYSV